MDAQQNPEMIVLAVDTTQPQLALALARGAELIAQKKDDSSAPHTARLFLCLDELLQECGITLQEINAIAVNTGPGSFTGLRVGLSAVQGIAAALKIPIVGINAIDAHAYLVEESSAEIVVLLNGAREEMFLGARRLATDNAMRVGETDFSIPVQNVAAFLAFHYGSKPILLVGSGATAHWAELSVIDSAWRLVYPENEIVAVIATTAIRLLNKQGSEHLVQAYYIRPSEAELKLKS